MLSSDFRLLVLLLFQLFLLSLCAEQNHHRHHHFRHRIPYHRRICERYPRHTTAQRTPGDNGFRIRVLGVPSPDGYIPGEVYTVVINGTYPRQTFRGFMLVAVPQGAKSENVTAGTFKSFGDEITKEAEQCSHTVMTHQTMSKAKSEVSLMWVAPSAGGGCVELRATVIEHAHIWYKDDGALTKVFCEAGQGDAAIVDNVSECCACGYASYKLTFENNWSHHNHPRDFPPKIYEPLLHWSNVVGASHNSNYRIWAYGQYSSPGVKQVCEFGYPNTVERELKEHKEQSDDIRTVVKTTSIFNMRETREARFTVDKTHHLFSFLSMLGPSPDWCVGLSAYDMCLPNCSWAHDQVIELYPWDAGTDGGLTYMSKNVKSNPPEKIHRITNTFPAHPEAPFYNPGLQMKPVARMYLQRLYPHTDAECSESGQDPLDEDDSSPSDDELIALMKKKMMMHKKTQIEKCSTTEWADWTECTVTCGVGFKYRKRVFNNAMVSEEMCNLSLRETDNCIGVENTCGGDLSSIYSYRQQGRLPNKKKKNKKFEVRYDEAPDPNDVCAMTPWSDWSPCSVTCGKGMHERFRMFLHKAGTEGCSQSRMEKDICMASVLDCRKAAVMKNFTALCSQSSDRGLCRGSFQRWYYDTIMQKCLPFDYTGCRGNDNNFETMDECSEICGNHMADLHSPRNDGARESAEADDLKLLMMKKQQMMEQQQREADELKLLMMKKQQMLEQQERQAREQREREAWEKRQSGPKVDCMVTPWTAWTPCSVSCGKGITTKVRMIKVEPQNGGRKCPRRLMKKKKCKRRKCAINCKMSKWTNWSACPKTCGNDVIQDRRRRVLKRPKHGGRPCDSTLERRYCNLPLCPNQESRKSSKVQYYDPMQQSGL